MNVDLNIAHLFQKRSLGISVELKSSSDLSLHAVEIELSKKELSVLKVHDVCFSLDELTKTLSKQSPIYLCINGKGLIHKIVDDSLFDDANYFTELLPQAKKEDFYIQRYQLANNRVSISLIRRNQLDSIIDHFITNKYNLLSILFSNEILVNISGLIDDKAKTIHGLGQDLTLEEGELSSISKADNKGLVSTINLDDFKLDIPLQLSFAAAIQHFHPDPKLKSAHSEQVAINHTSHKKKRFNQLASLALGTLLFVALIINSIAFLNLKSRVDNLNAAISTKKVYLDEVNLLSKDLQSKKAALNKVNLDHSTISYFSDRIASILPSSILLNEMNVYPVEKSGKADDFQEYDYKAIRLSGVIRENNQLHEFIQELKTLDWVQDVEMVSFDKEKSMYESEFVLKLKLV